MSFRRLRIARDVLTHPANRRAPVAALVRATAWELQRRRSAEGRDIQLLGGATLRCPPRSGNAEKMLRYGGWADYDEMGFLSRYLRAGDVVVDVGANVGSYTLCAASYVGPSGAVHAFEPSPEHAHWLEGNVARNDYAQVLIHRTAAGAAAGTLRFRTDADTQNRLDDQGDLDVSVVRLDDVLPPEPVAFLKVDVEGAELGVLEGLGDRLGRDVAVIQLELNAQCRRYGTSEAEVAGFLEARGYALARYDYSTNVWTRDARPWEHTDNAFAVLASAWGEVLARLG